MRLLAGALLLAACYSPDVPPGGYLCSTSDQACPKGQHCACGLCVDRDNQAACGLSVEVTAQSVKEHQPFDVTIRAKAKDGSAATGFNGTVDLSFTLADGKTRWADVRPAQAKLKDGVAKLQVTVNRETIPPQAPRLTATFAQSSGSSTPISVSPRPFVKGPMPVASAPYAWATVGLASGMVVPDGKQLRMYFAGYPNMMSSGVGLATSNDNGLTWQPHPDKLFPGTGSVFNKLILSAAPYQIGQAWQLAVAGSDSVMSPTGDISIASSPDGKSTFALANGGNAILKRTDCPYCGYSVWFPSVLTVGDGKLMFFTATQCQKPAGCDSLDGVAMSIGRAHSADGVVFTPEPAPVLSGEQGGEAYLAAASVMLDGSVFKMWYAFARSFNMGQPCRSDIRIGYATSADGFYWVRSPSNPVLAVGGSWDKDAPGMLVSSVVPLDGADPASGLQAYYSVFVDFLGICILNNIGRAVAY
jgi:hypothetical protein